MPVPGPAPRLQAVTTTAAHPPRAGGTGAAHASGGRNPPARGLALRPSAERAKCGAAAARTARVPPARELRGRHAAERAEFDPANVPTARIPPARGLRGRHAGERAECGPSGARITRIPPARGAPAQTQRASGRNAGRPTREQCVFRPLAGGSRRPRRSRPHRGIGSTPWQLRTTASSGSTAR